MTNTNIKDLSILVDLSKSLVEYLRANYNPHCKIIITLDRVRLMEDVVGFTVPMEEVANNAVRP